MKTCWGRGSSSFPPKRRGHLLSLWPFCGEGECRLGPTANSGRGSMLGGWDTWLSCEHIREVWQGQMPSYNTIAPVTTCLMWSKFNWIVTDNNRSVLKQGIKLKMERKTKKLEVPWRYLTIYWTKSNYCRIWKYPSNYPFPLVDLYSTKLKLKD